MLVLSRKSNEAINIDSHIVVRIVKVRGKQVTIGIQAPRQVRIVRGELREESHESLDRTRGE